MVYGISRTPLYAAFFCVAIFAGCGGDHHDPQESNTKCPTGGSSIASVQGDAPRSPLQGQQVTVQGIVTLIQDNGDLYIEEPGSDKNSRTSNAILLQASKLVTEVEQGSLISVRGTVAESGDKRYPVTTLTDIDELIKCADGQTLPLTDVSLPLNGLGREALEGMRLQIDESLIVTDVYQLGRGNFTLSGNGMQYVPTEVMAPGPGTSDMLALNRSFALPVFLRNTTDHENPLLSGTSIEHLSGVLAHDGRGLRVSLQSIQTGATVPLNLPLAAMNGSLRIVGMNLHNYFNGDGKGRGFPTPRGAKTKVDFRKQRSRIGAAIKALNPDVLGVMELENDGFGPQSASEDFIQLAENETGNSWAATRPAHDNTGDDAITVGMFYRTDRLKTIGPAQTLTGTEFTRSRQPQAQLFQQLTDGGKVLVVVNHLKSKGSCPDSGENSNQKDGQGCWNPMRLASAKKMAAWAKNIATAAGTDNILILGDMNAYRLEQPVSAIRDAGFTELMDGKPGENYSFVYYGQHGTLDYAFSSDALLEDVQQAFIWHVNSPVPSNIELPQAWSGFSDHDPVVVDVFFRQSITSD